MPRPNLYIIGAAKSGTTSLHWALDRHPDIFMSPLKEPAFFVPELPYHPKDEGWYLDLFREAESVPFAGESSTHYAKIPLFEGVPERLHSFAPDARLIYVMRDPIDRAVSHYWHNTRSTRPEFTERRPMLQAIREDPLYRAYGDYEMQLRPWIERFGRRAVLPVVYEEMVRDGAPVLERIQRWLELSPSARVTLEHRNRRPGSVIRPRGRALLYRFSHSRLWDSVAPLVPKSLKARARKLALREDGPAFDDEYGEVIELLRPWARERIQALSAFLGRDFLLWRTSLG